MNTNLEEKLEAIVAPICRAHNLELVEVRFAPGGGLVRVTIDRPSSTSARSSSASGVSLEDCTNVSRDLGSALDLQEGLISSNYRLEVSSPGPERPLVKRSDFDRFAGEMVKVRTKMAVDNRSSFQGELLGVAADDVRLRDGESTLTIPFESISRAHLIARSASHQR